MSGASCAELFMCPVAAEGGFRGKHGAHFVDLDPADLEVLERLCPRSLLLQLLFERLHVSMGDIQNTSHLEHVRGANTLRSVCVFTVCVCAGVV